MKPARACVRAIATYLPPTTLTNEALASELGTWSAAEIEQKTGIAERRVAAPDECASDLAVAAAERLFAAGVERDGIDLLVLCTQSPDHALPTTACLLQARLRLSTRCAAFDFNLGCSGWVYGLGIAKGFLETGQATRAIVLTAETYTKLLGRGDRSVRTLFGDGAAATLVDLAGPDEQQEHDALLGPFVYGTDGRGGEHLIVPAGGARRPRDAASGVTSTDENGNVRSANDLFMNGPEVFRFTLDVVPTLVAETLARAGITLAAVDLVVLHQASKLVLDQLRRKLKVPPERFHVALRTIGNTVSSTIPFALEDAARAGALRPGANVLAVGFGVGLSWGATLLRWMPR